jgi:hypothetical protein
LAKLRTREGQTFPRFIGSRYHIPPGKRAGKMRLYLLKLKNRPRYFAAKLTRAVLLDLDCLLRPGKRNKKHLAYDFQRYTSEAKDYLTYDNPSYSRAIQQIESITSLLEKILLDAHFNSIKNDHYTIHSFFLLREALALIYKNLIALIKEPTASAVKLIAVNARENLRLARKQAATTDAEILGDQKFNAMHNSFGKCFEHLEKYADELAGIN